MIVEVATPARKRDDGSVLPLVLVFSVVLAMVVVALATYASATLRLGQVAERSSDRLASANGAMDSALEDLQRGVGPCMLLGRGYTITDSVNDMSPEVDCNWVGGRFNVGDLFAVVMTGAGTGRSGPLLTVTNGGNSPNAQKIFEGPVYMASTPKGSDPNPTMEFSADLTIKNADLMYSAADCKNATPALVSHLTIAPVGYGTQCYEDPWNDPAMFGAFRPPEPGINTSSFPDQLSSPPAQDALGCYIWSPGRYTSAPQTLNGSFNYFRSGDYYFEGIGDWAVKNAFALFGYPGAKGPGIPGIKHTASVATNPCRDAWKNDPNTSGATVYFGGNSQLTVDGLGAVEISGRERSGQNIAVQALETNGIPSTIKGDQRIIQTRSGGNKQLAIQGLVWAPYAALEFDLISNEAVAALTGGAVVSELSAGASANTNNFLIRVDTNPANKVLNLTTTATSPNNQGSTSVRSVVTVQIDKGAKSYAVNSRRVVGLTAEGAAPPPPSPTTTVPSGTTSTVPVPTSGPCNEIKTDWTYGFGAGDWKAEYWNLASFDPAPPADWSSGPPTVTAQMSEIKDNPGTGSPKSGVNSDHYAARFTKTITVAAACSVTIRAGSDDGVRVRIDGATVINGWSEHSYSTTTAITPTLTAGTHTIVMEYFERTKESRYELQWKSNP